MRVLTPNLKILRFTRFIIHSQAGGSWVGNIYSRTFTAFFTFCHCTKKTFCFFFFSHPVYSAEFQVKLGFWCGQVYHLINNESYHLRRAESEMGDVVSNLTERQHSYSILNVQMKQKYASLCSAGLRSETSPGLSSLRHIRNMKVCKAPPSPKRRLDCGLDFRQTNQKRKHSNSKFSHFKN